MDGHLAASLRLEDHSAGCPTSPAQPLWLPDNPEIYLLAYGCDAGAVVVRVVQVNDFATVNGVSAAIL